MEIDSFFNLRLLNRKVAFCMENCMLFVEDIIVLSLMYYLIAVVELCHII